MGGTVPNARSAEGQASVSTGGSAMCVSSVEGRVSASTGGTVPNARSAEGQASASMVGGAVCARSVEAVPSVSTVGSDMAA